MIRSLVEAPWERWKSSSPPVSRQKKDALFELALRITLMAEKARETEGGSVQADAAAEKRKTLRYGLELLAEGADAERLDQAYELAPIFKDLDAGTRLELAMVKAGLGSMARGEHPFFTLRRMSAFLGPDYFEKTSAWLAAKLKRRRKSPLSLLVPGDLPDLARNLALDPRALERSLRAAGRGLSAAAFAGCPQETIDLAAAYYGKTGGASFQDDARYLRSRFSGDEIAQAQAAFVEIVRSLEADGELELGAEDEFASDPAYVKELSRAVMAMDEKLLRLVIKAGESRTLALAMQGMEPRAHDKILGLLSKRETRRILDAIDDSAILPRRDVQAAGKAFARSVLSSNAKPGSLGAEARESFSRVRDWGEPEPGGG